VALFKKERIKVRNKRTICVTISPELYEWVMFNCEKKVFHSRSHAVEYCLFTVMNDSEEG
jgi:hypothetical protein